jgi:hypothetical protein
MSVSFVIHNLPHLILITLTRYKAESDQSNGGSLNDSIGSNGSTSVSHGSERPERRVGHCSILDFANSWHGYGAPAAAYSPRLSLRFTRPCKYITVAGSLAGGGKLLPLDEP